MSVINPGELKDSLTILGVTNDGAIDEYGFPKEGVQKLFTLRCKKKTISTKEYIAADKESSELQLKFIIRKRKIDNEMMIDYRQELYNIKHVHEIDEMFLELTATRGS